MAVNKVGSGSAQSVQSGEAAKRAERTKPTSESKSTDKAGAVAGETGARAEISARAREFSKAKEVAASAPDIREEKIADLKRRIASGQYKIDSDAIADRMIQDHASL